MALDTQSNWNVEMAQPLKLNIRPSTQPEPPSTNNTHHTFAPPSRQIPLPLEIISHILTFIPHHPASQPTLHACTLVSRTWYSASIARLYQNPHLTGGNFNSFVPIVCPSKNAHIRQSHLAVLVRRLDMGELVHNSSKSLTARLLGRLKGNIEEFVAPQASFAVNSFAALSKCTRLRYLDLSLISASVPNFLLFQTLKNLQSLETLFFPRSSNKAGRDVLEPANYQWPPKLKALHLAGGIDREFLQQQLVNVPSSLTHFSIQHCSQVYTQPLLNALEVIGPRLQHLTIRHPMARVGVGAMDTVLTFCPQLVAFRISADFISDNLFGSIPVDHPLQILDLDCSGTAGVDAGVQPAGLYEAVETGLLSNLRSVRVSARLAWGATKSGRGDIKDLTEAMEDLDQENPLGIEPIGVFISYD